MKPRKLNTTAAVLAEVTPLCGTVWGFQREYELFVGEKCPECGKRGCRDSACLAARREAEQRAITGAVLADVLGVGTTKVQS